MTDAGWSKRLQTIGDAAILGRAFVKNWALAGRMVLSRGPLEMRRRINRFAWLKTVAAPKPTVIWLSAFWISESSAADWSWQVTCALPVYWEQSSAAWTAWLNEL